MKITANLMHFQELNSQVRNAHDNVIIIDNCIGQRYIGSGLSGKKITINGTPGNALGAYLDGAGIEVFGNAQDATGDTMNEGEIIIHGSSGDATGYAMRGGKILVKGDAGYRAGIHMKAYEDKIPKFVIGGCAGSFLGEYQAGGVILVLGIGKDDETPIVGNFCGTGMHGGKIYLRTDKVPDRLPAQVAVSEPTDDDMEEIAALVEEYCGSFGGDSKKILKDKFLKLLPNTKNPYKRLYKNN
ncbi:MAG: glutamate synthase [Ruminococcus sp.]|nr:glutamate synthase [Ruminococcus sp.]